jgi:hypothetical protein
MKMIKKLKRVLPQVAAIALLLGLAALIGVNAAYAQIGDEPELKGISGVAKSGSLKENIITIVNWGLGFVGIIAVIFLIYGGFTYITAAGDESKLDTAKNTIIYAIVGIVVILLAFVIVRAVGGIF